MGGRKDTPLASVAGPESESGQGRSDQPLPKHADPRPLSGLGGFWSIGLAASLLAACAEPTPPSGPAPAPAPWSALAVALDVVPSTAPSSGPRPRPAWRLVVGPQPGSLWLDDALLGRREAARQTRSWEEAEAWLRSSTEPVGVVRHGDIDPTQLCALLAVSRGPVFGVTGRGADLREGGSGPVGGAETLVEGPSPCPPGEVSGGQGTSPE